MKILLWIGGVLAFLVAVYLVFEGATRAQALAAIVPPWKRAFWLGDRWGSYFHGLAEGGFRVGEAAVGVALAIVGFRMVRIAGRMDA